MTDNEMAGWHCQLNEHEFEQTLGVGDRQGGLTRCGPWGHKESDMTELNCQLLDCEYFSSPQFSLFSQVPDK